MSSCISDGVALALKNRRIWLLPVNSCDSATDTDAAAWLPSTSALAAADEHADGAVVGRDLRGLYVLFQPFPAYQLVTLYPAGR